MEIPNPPSAPSINYRWRDTIISHKPVKGVKLVAWGYIFTILLKKSIFSDPHQLYTTVLHVCRRYLSVANWGHLRPPWPPLQQCSSTMWPEQQAPTNHQGISDLAIVSTNNCNLHNMWKYSLKPMFVPQTHYLFGDSHADAEICALTWATFGVGTNIKSILLTLIFSHVV